MIALLAGTCLAAPAFGQETWLANPGSSDFNTASNWDPASVPTGIAIFANSSITTLTFSGSRNVDAFQFDPGAPAYTFNLTSGFGIRFNGDGIVNNSSNAPIFNVASSIFEFDNASSAGNAIINLTAGTVSFLGNSTAGAAQLNAAAGTSFDFTATTGQANNGAISAGSIAGAGDYLLGNNQLTVGSNNLSTTVDGVISGAGASLVKIGTGTLTLTNANTYGGGTTINAGTLSIANDNALGTGDVAISGGTLRSSTTPGGTITLGNNIIVSGTSGIAAATGTTFSLAGGFAFGAPSSVTTFGSASDRGIVLFDAVPGVPDTTASFVVAGGTLKDGSGGNLGSLLGSLASTTVNSGVTLDLANSVFPSIRNLRGAGSVVIGADPVPGAAALSIGADPGTAQEFSGVISGPGSLEVFTVPGGPPNVPGRVILSGENTYGGNTYICDCTELQIGNGGTTGSIPGNVFNAGVLIFNRSNTYVFNGVIADDPSLPGSPGKVIQAGTGTTVLTAANTYTGGTTISGGTLQLGNGGASGSIVGDVLNNATLAFNRSDSYTFGGTISGSGAVQQNGTGTTILTADNTYTGGTTINAGTLQLGNAGTTGSIVGNVVNNGSLVFLRSNNLTFSGVISGTGAVSQNGTGVVTLTANNSYTGGTNIGGGSVLQLGVNNALPVGGALMIFGAGTFDLANFNQTVGALSGTGAITLGSGTLTVAGAGTSTYAGVISGSGSLVKANTGTLILSGVNTYTGPTTVNAGSLIVNGSIVSAATVNAGGLIGGTGTLGSTTINGGTLSPGNSIGTIAVAGNLTFVGAGNYLVEVSPAAADRTNVSGTATLTGTVRATFGPGTYIPGTSYTILSAGVRSGEFSAIEQIGLPALRASLEYTATDVLLRIKTFNIAGVAGLSGNQQSVANTIQSAFNTAGTLPTPFFTLASLPNGSLQNALSQASGEIATGAAAAGFQSMDLFLNLMLDPFLETRLADGSLQGRALGFAPEQQTTLPAAMSAYAGLPIKAPPRASFEQRWTVWGAAAGATGQYKGDAAAGSSTLDVRGGIFAAGIDYRVSPDTVIGFAVAGGTQTFGLDGVQASGRSNAVQGGVYGSTRFGNAYLSAAAAYARHDVSTERNVAFTGMFDRLTADYGADSFGGRIEGGYRIAASERLGITPYAAVQAQRLQTPNYGETDRTGILAFALNYAGQSWNDTRSELGARADYRMMMDNGALLTLRGRAAWAHDYDTGRTINAVFQALPGFGFTVAGASPAADSALVSAGAELKFRNGVALRAKFDGEFANRSNVYGGSGGIYVSW
jgi:autotransporter-associated beta strand protein